jgi:hypothetical protein
MKITKCLAELQKDHVVMELECIDRMYLNAYVPKLTSEGGIAALRSTCISFASSAHANGALAG